jgi:hypothetical protein
MATACTRVSHLLSTAILAMMVPASAKSAFFRNVDHLHAAPPAAAARSHGEALARPEQPYLSYDADAKAAHAAWQPPEQAGWRQVLEQKKHRAANKTQIEEAEQEQAAKLIQVRRMWSSVQVFG